MWPSRQGHMWPCPGPCMHGPAPSHVDGPLAVQLTVTIGSARM
jgi:hypothetical protein